VTRGAVIVLSMRMPPDSRAGGAVAWIRPVALRAGPT
jgi:hypothetical protein